MRPLFLICLLFSLAFSPCLLVAAESNYHRQQVSADRLYAEGKYEEAMKQYLPLAKKGDSFSQYRISYMYLEGQGQEPDLIESFAWAYLAAQNYQPELVRYRDTVSSLIPESEQRKATRRVDYYMRKWGNAAIANDVVRATKKELRGCTGSRLGARCEDLEIAQMPQFYGIAPGNGSNPGSGGDGGGAAPSGTTATVYGRNASGTSRDVAYYQQLRASLRDMNTYIEGKSGVVTIGETKVPEEPTPNQVEDDGR